MSGCWQENYGVDKVVPSHHETPDYVKTMGHAPVSSHTIIIFPFKPIELSRCQYPGVVGLGS